MSSRGFRVDLLALVLGAAVLGGCSAGSIQSASSTEGSSVSPTTTTDPSPSPAGLTAPTPSGAHMAKADGLTLAVSVDRSVVAPGEVVTFTATLENGTTRPVNYSVPWCGGAASVAVSVDLPKGSVGKTWKGIAQTFKQYVLTEALGPGGVRALAPVTIDAVAEPCTNGQHDSEAVLAPGQAVTSSLAWKAEIVPGI